MPDSQQFRDASPCPQSSRQHGQSQKPKAMLSRSTDMPVSHCPSPPQTSPLTLSPRRPHEEKELSLLTVMNHALERNHCSCPSWTSRSYPASLSLPLASETSRPIRDPRLCIPSGGMEARRYLQNVPAQRDTEEAHV